jgi:membrane-associated phospholipid phosphatase
MDFMEFMYIYQDAFNPVYFLLLCSLPVLYYDWRNAGGSLGVRILTVLFSWVTAFAIYKSYFILAPNAPQCVEDFFAVAGLTMAIAITAFIWRMKGYGREMIGAIIAAIAVSIPYTLISPFWNISGHVAYTAGPVIYLTSLNRKFVALLPIPLLMVVNRPLVHAHTWEQSIAGFFLGFLALAGVLYLRGGRRCTTY